MPSLASLGLPQCQILFSACSPKPHLLQRSTLPFYKHQLASLRLPQISISSSSSSMDSEGGSLSSLSPLEAIVFDIDGTLCDSDPLHFSAFRELLQGVGFNGGVPITEEFYSEKISGGHNEDLCGVLFPDWDLPKARKLMEEKENLFRRLATGNLDSVKGLRKLCSWIEDHGLKRAAATNAPRPNAELMLSVLGLTDFFPTLIIGEECERAKPFPDPYLKALQAINVSHKHAFVFEDSVSGVKAGVAAGMPVIGLSTRNPEKLLIDAGAIFVIKDFDDPKLWKALEELEVKAELSTAAT